MTTVKIKRIYEPAEKSDGFRVLVDRLWPRGMKKETAHIDAWMKEVAPSAELRKWFNHEPEKWQEFKKSYKSELKNTDAIKELIRQIRKHQGSATLLYGAKDETHNQAVVLQQLVNAKIK